MTKILVRKNIRKLCKNVGREIFFSSFNIHPGGIRQILSSEIL